MPSIDIKRNEKIEIQRREIWGVLYKSFTKEVFNILLRGKTVASMRECWTEKGSILACSSHFKEFVFGDEFFKFFKHVLFFSTLNLLLLMPFYINRWPSFTFSHWQSSAVCVCLNWLLFAKSVFHISINDGAPQ